MAIMENPFAGDSKTGESKRLGGPAPKLTKKMSQKFEKTKVVASAGMKKMKEGTASTVGWIKVKMNKNKLFEKK
ncbi:hypothetical protein Leryth_002259 [Lithospermum erythrorhizon]|uniref:Uncharacterized protein n=1 Tax=Lithospermum erythrorhizon TaxID=34254 RepID=A0AAV3RFU2_LITER|nr:hypothetical protein Leryth_002259 [Lithospermum erythrorhizon]